MINDHFKTCDEDLLQLIFSEKKQIIHSVTAFHRKLRSMAPRTSTGKTWRSQQLSALLSSAILEWVLMLLLLLLGLLSYLVTTFAHLCKLQPPCPLCTRLDHVLGKAKPGFYRDLMCNSHKAEASSWAFCHIHQKLVDVHSMCEACILSFATDNKSNLETYQSLVGKLGVGIGDVGCGHDFSLSSASEAPVTKEDTLCSCCSRPSKVKSYPFVVLQRKDSGVNIVDICGDVSRYQCIDEINHVAYSELKTSDSESEPRQHGGNVRSLPEDATDNLKEEFTLGHAQTKLADGNAQEKLVKHSELTPIQNGSSHKKPSEDSGELRNIQADGKANPQSTDLPGKGGQEITEDSDTRDKSEDDVWHNALSSIDELPGVDKSFETNTASDEMKAEFSDRTTWKDSFRVHENLKLLLSQLSTFQVPDSLNDFIDSQREQAILQNITRVLSLERNYSGISESMVNEAEGEHTIDQMNQQIELDRKSISLLWKELEEERNASAVAANQTMAMITRLQEEKAAVQMEALQYQRMMEEQSEYDREDLQKMTDIVQKLETEIESYKIKLRNQLLVNEIRDQMHLSCSKKCEPSISRTTEPLCGFEDEKAYISKHLRKLKKKLHQFSNNSQFVEASKLTDKEGAVDITSSEDVYEDADEDADMENLVVENHVRRNGNNNLKYLSIGIKDLTLGKDDPKGQYYAMVSENDLASFEDDISELSGRLKALEADRNFLEHSINSLKTGKEGEELIHDIACSLRELRKMGITWKEYD